MSEDKNEFCHKGMTCEKGCGCADENGICQCAMQDETKCVCNGHCKSPEKQK